MRAESMMAASVRLKELTKLFGDHARRRPRVA